MYPRTPFPSTFNTSQFPLSAPSGSIHISQCRLLCTFPTRTYARPFSTLLLFQVHLSRPFGRLSSAIVQHARRIRVVNAILFYSHLHLYLLLPHLLSDRSFSLPGALADVLTFTYG